MALISAAPPQAHRTDRRWAPVEEVQASRFIHERADVPLVLRGVARDWPALQRWTFDHLAALDADRRVTLVVGNRELGATAFVSSTFGECVSALASGSASVLWGSGTQIAHLKEFDLLKAFPSLRQDLRSDELFPSGQIVASSAWIGPQGARTGLHHDLLDNLALLVRGSKRFLLARPGVVEAQGAQSAKYDRWARLASIDIHCLAERCLPPDSLFVAELQAGDALYVPRGWWHEVVNLRASVFLSGFFGPRPRVVGLWLQTGLRQLLHDANRFSRRSCTCHAGA